MARGTGKYAVVELATPEWFLGSSRGHKYAQPRIVSRHSTPAAAEAAMRAQKNPNTAVLEMRSATSMVDWQGGTVGRKGPTKRLGTLPAEPKRRFRPGTYVVVKRTGENGSVQRYDAEAGKYLVRVGSRVVWMASSSLEDAVAWAKQQQALNASLRKDR